MMHKRLMLTFMAAVLAIAAAMCLLGGDCSEAVADVEKTDEPSWGGFTDVDSGYFKVYLKNNTTEAIEVRIAVFDPVSGDNEATLVASLPGDGAEHEFRLSFGYGSDGTKLVSYKVENNANGNVYITDGAFEIEVSHSMWKDATTYIAIVIVIIVLVVLIYFVMRGRSAKRLENAPVKTFTEMDAERKAKKSGKVAEKKTYAPGEKKKRK